VVSISGRNTYRLPLRNRLISEMQALVRTTPVRQKQGPATNGWSDLGNLVDSSQFIRNLHRRQSVLASIHNASPTLQNLGSSIIADHRNIELPVHIAAARSVNFQASHRLPRPGHAAVGHDRGSKTKMRPGAGRGGGCQTTFTPGSRADGEGIVLELSAHGRPAFLDSGSG